MESRQVIVQNPHGLHLRVAAEIVRIAQENGAEVRLHHGEDKEATGKSVLELLLLEAGPGSVLRVEVDGPKATTVADHISELFSDGAGI